MAFSRITAAILGLCLAGVNAASAETRRLDIVGTGDGIDVLRAIAANFMQQEGSVQIEVPPSIGSGGGIAAVGSGKAILGRIARRLTDLQMGDVPTRHLMCPVHSAGRRRPDQAACLSNQAAGSTPTPLHARSSHHDLNNTEEPSAAHRFYSSGGCQSTGR